jgi:hypothetical protein
MGIEMAEAIYVIKENVYFTWFALLVFFSGFCSSYLVNYFDIKFLSWFSRWFMKAMSRYVNPKASFTRIFLIIFFFNSISIAVYMTSGLFVIFPFIIAFLTGMNIGLTVFIPQEGAIEGFEVSDAEGAGRIMKFVMFSTFVLAIEMITFSLALGMGMSLGVAMAAVSGASATATNGAAAFIADLLTLRFKAYFIFCVPALAVSAYMEASVIKGS